MKKLFIYFLLILFTVSSIYAGGKREEPALEVSTSGLQYISPNNDGIKDSAELFFTVSLYAKSRDGYVPEYGIKINDESGKTVKEIVKTEKADINWFIRLFTRYSKFTLEKSIVWDGTSEDGSLVREGIYDLSIWVKDPSGKVQEADLDSYVVDVTPPFVSLSYPANKKFSPGAHDVLNTFTITHENSTMEYLWVSQIRDSEGTTVRKQEWDGRPPEEVVWDGKDDNGVILEDGEYIYAINSTDLAGNKMDEQRVEGIIIDTRSPDVIFELDDRYVSPNNDGIKDTITLTFGQKDNEGFLRWVISVNDKDGKVIYTFEDTEPGVYEAVFDGQDDSGSSVPDGIYTVSFFNEYDNGAKSTVSEQIMVDRKPPVINVTVLNRVFSPDFTDRINYAEIEMKSDETVTWQGTVKDADGNTLVETSDKETTSLVVWDGTDDSGSAQPDGDYYFSAVFTDLAGNSTAPPAEVITIDRIDKSLDVMVIPGAARIRENLDDGSGVYFKILADNYKDVETWTMEISSSDNEKIYVFEGSGTIPDHILWDGKVQSTGEEASEGLYDAYFKVVYNNGSAAEKTVSGIFYDITPPLIDIDVYASPFAAADGSYEAEVEFVLEVKDNHMIYDWSIDIMDHETDKLRTISGDGDPPSYIDWYGETDGNKKISEDSVLSAVATVTDMSGNSSSIAIDIPFDPALVRIDSRYYINTPDVIFSAYKYAIDSAGKEKADINMESIKRAADFYSKYPGFKIIVEGHALNVLLGTGGERERREEAILETLTENRALTVKRELVKLGVPEANIEIKAMGGKQPVESVTDLENRWKNRRVIFNIDYMY